MEQLLRVAAISALLFVAVADPTSTKPQVDMKNARPYPLQGWDLDAAKDLALPEPLVVGGSEAEQGQFPYQAAIFLVLPDMKTYFCGGSLISQRYVLTAAHCAISALTFRVVLGAHVVTDTSEPYRVEIDIEDDAIIHPSYDASRKRYDVALLRLPQPVVFNEFIKAVRLPSSLQADTNTTFEDSIATVSGWGKTSDDDPRISNKLHFANVAVIRNPVCMWYYLSALYAIHYTQICTSGENGANPCNGDSGGPLVVIEEDGVATQIGVVSFGFAKCQNGYPSAYSRLTFFLDFVQENTDVTARESLA